MGRKPADKSTAEYSAVRLSYTAKRINTLAVPAARVAEEMEKFGIAEISIGRQPSLETALDSLRIWCDAIEAAWNEKIPEIGKKAPGTQSRPRERKQPAADRS